MMLLDKLDCRRASIPLLVLQTIAANLGSMATPVGNPQNLYLYAAYELTPGDFFPAVLPLTAISLVCLAAAALPVLPTALPGCGWRSSPCATAGGWRCTGCCSACVC